MDWKKRGIGVRNRVRLDISCDFSDRRSGADGKGADEERRARTARSEPRRGSDAVSERR